MPTDNGAASQGDGGSQEEFTRWFREFFNSEVRPLLERRQDEIIEARVADLRSWVQTHASAIDPQVVAAQVGQILSPKLTAEIQPLADTVNKLAERVNVLSGQTPSGVLVADGQESATQNGQNILMIAESLLDMAGAKLLPMFQQWQMVKRQTVYDVQWAASLRQSDPGMAVILGNVLNPDPLINTLPSLLAQNSMAVGSGAYLRGLQTRIDAQKMLVGSGLWPGAPSSTSPSPSASPSGAPSGTHSTSLPSSSATKSGVSMQQRWRSGRKKTSDLSFGTGKPTAKKLVDFLR